jgi:hypothetical protein
LRAALFFSAAVRSLELRHARARVASGSPELGREEEGATANSMAGKGHKSTGREGRTAVRKPRAGRRNSSEPFRPWGGGLRRAKALANFSRCRGDTGTYSGELDWAKSADHHVSTTDRHGRAPAKMKLAEHRAQSRKLGTRMGVTEPPKSLSPPTVVLVHWTSDNPIGAPDHLTSSVFVFFTLLKSVSPVTQILQHIGGTSMQKQLQQLILY